MNRGAGILFLSQNDTALFLRRSATAPDCAGCWALPGGGTEGDETAEQTAVREAREEVGAYPDGKLIAHTRTKGTSGQGVATATPQSISVPAMPDVDFTTFIQRVDEEFTPALSDEHDGWAWAPINSPPQPLHPGCQISLDRITMDELGVARAIAAGKLTSPQKYENVWLFAIRITGTDIAYRKARDEFVHRNPDNYLNDEFLARCNGLTVVYLQRSRKEPGFHPSGALLTNDEFVERVVGSIFLPYIAGTEVWGIAKIYDDAAAEAMETRQLSTSPSVFFRDVTANHKLQLPDGATLLIENNPSLLDHVAICEQGVWDKGGEPTGVRSESRGDSAMTEAEMEAKKKADAEAEEKKKADAEKEAADKAKADADAGVALDKKLSHIADALDNMHKRMDSMEAADKARKDAEEKDKREKGDPEQLAADKARKDEEDKKKAEDDKAKKDAEEAEKKKADDANIQKRIDAVAAMIPKSIGDADYTAMTDAQARADEVYAKFGKTAPRPLQGETPALYDRRVIRDLKAHSPTWKAVDIGAAFADDASFGIVRDQVYREAIATAMNPATVPAGQLRMVTKRQGGHEINEWVGDPRTWMNPLAGATQLRGEGTFLHGNLGKA